MKRLFTFLAAAFACVLLAVASPAHESNSALRPITVGHKILSANQRTAFPLGGERIGSAAIASPNHAKVSPLAATPLPGTIYGYLSFSYNNNAVFGLNTVSRTGDIKGMWFDSLYGTDGAQMSCGWLRNGKLCGFSALIYYSVLGAQLIYIDYVEYDFSNGTVTTKERYDSENRIYLQSGVYNTKDGYIYGYGNDKNGNFVFAKAPVDKPTELEVVKTITNDAETCFSMTYNADDNTIYGVNGKGQFVKVSVGGVQTSLMSVAEANADRYITGLAYLSTDDRFYWNAIDVNEQAAFYSINLSDKTMTKVCDFGFEEQFNYFCSLVEEGAPQAPAKATYVSNTFTEGAQSGTITYTLPSKLNNGTSIPSSSTLDWELRIDGSVFNKGTGTPGQNVTAAANSLARGQHIFSLLTTLDNQTSINSPKTLFIGHDTPVAPTNVTLSTDGQLKWDAVTTGINNGYVDLAKLTYIIRSEGSELMRTSSTNCKIDIPSGAQLTSFGVEVTAEANGYESAPTASNRIVVGGALKPDVFLTPTESESELFKIVDNNNDGTTWDYYEAEVFGLPCFYSGYSKTTDMDEWLFLPPIQLDDTQAYYDFSMMACYLSIMYPDEFCEVKIGKTATPSAMTGTIMPNTRMIAPDFESFGGKFKISEPGTYYIGVHCTSLADMYGICVSSFRVKKTQANGNSPAAVTDLTAVPGANGSYVATVKFKMPTTTLNGNAIASTATITATVTADEVKTVSGAPGSEQSVEVITKEGSNRIMVATSIGDLEGDIAWVDVFTGIQIPDLVKNLQGKVSDDMLSVELTWNPPTTGIGGELINTADVTYNVLLYNNDAQTWATIASGLTAQTYTFKLASGTAQSYYGFAIQTENSAGKNNNIRIWGTPLGKPYPLPMAETFDTEDDIAPFVVYQPTEDYVTAWQYTATGNLPEATSMFGYSLVATTTRAGTFARIGVPAFSTKGVNEASIDLNLYAGSRAAVCRIYYQACDMNAPELLTTINRTGGWRDASANLPAAALDKGWVLIFFDGEFEAANSIFAIDSFGVYPRTSALDSTIAERGAINATAGTIEVIGYEGSAIDIHTPQGATVAHRAKATSFESFAVAPGIYIVSAGENSVKVIVR